MEEKEFNNIIEHLNECTNEQVQQLIDECEVIIEARSQDVMITDYD